jgi:hypothetical protein
MSSGGLRRSGASLNGDDGTTASRGFPASFAPAGRAGGAAVSWAGPAVASAGPALAKRSTCAGGSGGGAGSSGPPSVSAATAARTCSSIESENAGRSTRAGGRSLLLPRTRRGSPAGSPGPVLLAVAGPAVSGLGSSGAGEAAGTRSPGRSTSSGECRDGGTRLFSRMRKPPGGVSGTPSTALQRSTQCVTFQAASRKVMK